MAGITISRRAEHPGAKGRSGGRPRAAVSAGHGAAAAREPGAHAGIPAGDMEPGAEPPDDDPSTRWPAPNPHAARVTSLPGRQSVHVVAAKPGNHATGAGRYRGDR